MMLGLVFLSAGFFLQAMADESDSTINGKKCNTGCVACLKIGSKTVDTKYMCRWDPVNQGFDCRGAAAACPNGYNKPHCTEAKLCS